MSFRARLLGIALVTLALGLVALIAAGDALLRSRVRAEVGSLLRARAEAELAETRVVDGRVRVRPVPGDPALDRGAWVVAHGRLVEAPSGSSPALDAAAVRLAARGQVAEANTDEETRLRALPLRYEGAVIGAVVVGLSVGTYERLRQQVLVGAAVIALLVLLAAAIVIRSALDGALRPVAEMTEAAEQWGAHDLERRFGLGPPRDEITGLAATLDHLLARIAASRRHEQRFASEVAHERRTPLAGLRARSEMALSATGPAAASERAEALRATVAQVDRLESAIDALLAVARQEIDPGSGSVDLEAIAREFDDVEVRVRSSLPPAEGEPDVVRRAIAPLVDNARRHASSRVALELDATDGLVRLAVRDDGPGLTGGLGEEVFEPGVRGDGADGGGAGLGLPLARRLARSCGGDVRLGDGPGGCFVLELPAVG